MKNGTRRNEREARNGRAKRNRGEKKSGIHIIISPARRTGRGRERRGRAGGARGGVRASGAAVESDTQRGRGGGGGSALRQLRSHVSVALNLTCGGIAWHRVRWCAMRC